VVENQLMTKNLICKRPLIVICGRSMLRWSHQSDRKKTTDEGGGLDEYKRVLNEIRSLSTVMHAVKQEAVNKARITVRNLGQTLLSRDA